MARRRFGTPYTLPLQDAWLYTLLDLDGTVVYVGITAHPRNRLRQHMSCSKWWRVVVRARWRHFASRVEALAAEREVIRRLTPSFNLTSGCCTDAHTESQAVM